MIAYHLRHHPQALSQMCLCGRMFLYEAETILYTSILIDKVSQVPKLRDALDPGSGGRGVQRRAAVKYLLMKPDPDYSKRADRVSFAWALDPGTGSPAGESLSIPTSVPRDRSADSQATSAAPPAFAALYSVAHGRAMFVGATVPTETPSFDSPCQTKPLRRGDGFGRFLHAWTIRVEFIPSPFHVGNEKF
ncbi:hypothetical protein FRB93_008918 [Tulasnella sp. JGI-2019a]|nr:hypothetical protein FRB93_008918 [Tulasnella sp. JGI-2019a]